MRPVYVASMSPKQTTILERLLILEILAISTFCIGK